MAGKIVHVHDVVDVNLIMRNWISMYDPPSGKVIDADWYLDQHKGKVAFTLMVQVPDKEDEDGGSSVV